LLYGAIINHAEETSGETDTHQNSAMKANEKQEVVEMQLRQHGNKLSTGTIVSYAPRLLKPAIKKKNKISKETQKQ
jgi:hypothetical protein